MCAYRIYMLKDACICIHIVCIHTQYTHPHPHTRTPTPPHPHARYRIRKQRPHILSSCLIQRRIPLLRLNLEIGPTFNETTNCCQTRPI